MGSASLAGRSILVVEDEPLIAVNLEEALQEMGANVLTARTLKAALDLAQQNEFSVAIVDFHLGGERCDGLCAELSQRGVPFLFYTGDSGHGLLNFGAPVISKPGSMEAIIVVLQRLMAATMRHRNDNPPPTDLPATGTE